MNPSLRRALVALCLVAAPSSAAAQDVPANAQRALDQARRSLAEGRKARLQAETETSQALEAAYREAARLQREADATRADFQALAAEAKRKAEARRRLERQLSRAESLLGQVAPEPEAAPADTTGHSDGHTNGHNGNAPKRGPAVPTVEARLEALERSLEVRVEDTEIVDRFGQRVSVPVIRFGAAQRLAVGDPPVEAGFLRPGEEARIAGPRVTDAQLAGIVEAARAGQGRLLVDPSGDLVDVIEPEQRTFLERGGPFAWPILFVGALGLLLIFERIIVLTRERAKAGLVEQVETAVEAGDRGRALGLVENGTTGVARVLSLGIRNLDDPRDAFMDHLDGALLREEPLLERSSGIIATCAAVAPLLGLLGTVSGMIETFGVVSSFGTGDPKLLSGGISVALVTTQLGLLVAVPLILGHALVRRFVTRRKLQLEDVRTRLLSLGGHSAD